MYHRRPSRRLLTRLLLPLMASVPLASALPVGAAGLADWPKFHYDLANSGFNPQETAIGAGNVGTLQLAWSAPNFVAGSAPVVAGGLVIGPCYQPAICAVDATTGQQRWVQPVGHVDIPSDVAVSGSVVYAGGASPATMYALNAQTGAVLWTWPSPPPGYDPYAPRHEFAAPTVYNGNVYAESDDGNLYAFDANTGSLRWTRAVATGGATPAVSNGVLYLEGDPQGPMQGELQAVSAQTGQVLWRSQSQWGDGFASPSLNGALVYSGSRNTPASGHPNFWAYRSGGCGTPSCPPVWSAAGGSYARSSPAVANGVVYEGFGDGKLYAFDASNGHLRWRGLTLDSQSTNPIGMWSSPAVANGVVFVAGGDGIFYAFNAAGCGQAACQPLWRSTTGHQYQFGSSPAVANGTVYVTGAVGAPGSPSYGSRLDAFRTATSMGLAGSRAIPPPIPQSGARTQVPRIVQAPEQSGPAAANNSATAAPPGAASSSHQVAGVSSLVSSFDSWAEQLARLLASLFRPS